MRTGLEQRHRRSRLRSGRHLHAFRCIRETCEFTARLVAYPPSANLIQLADDGLPSRSSSIHPLHNQLHLARRHSARTRLLRLARVQAERIPMDVARCRSSHITPPYVSHSWRSFHSRLGPEFDHGYQQESIRPRHTSVQTSESSASSVRVDGHQL